MLAANTIDKKITTLLPSLTSKQKKVVLSVVKTFAEEQEDIWQDEDFVKELDRRTAEFESGKVKGYTMEETIDAARKSFQKNQKK